MGYSNAVTIGDWFFRIGAAWQNTTRSLDIQPITYGFYHCLIISYLINVAGMPVSC